tara:strand:- start:195 stop:461 length:267 start_codon:yes stop_codon:yes gene_type:complete
MDMPSPDDAEKLYRLSIKALSKGCKECGFTHFVFQAAISVEEKCKVFFLMVECPMCESEYKDILEICELDEFDYGNINGDIDDRSLYK